MKRNLLLKLTAIVLIFLGCSAGAFAASTVYSVTGGGSYCSGGSGVAVNLSGSDIGVNYQLYNGASPVGGLVAGTGAPIAFGLQSSAGIYTVIADPSTANITNMSGSASVVVNPLPTAYTVTGGGGYCAGGSGSAVGLSFGSTGVQYTLFNGSSTISTVGGSNSSLNFGNMTAAGTYTVSAVITATGCSRNMNGNAVVVVNTVPTAFAVTGGGGYCAGGTGVAVGLAGSSAGVNYQLFTGSSAVGSPVAGTNLAISFGNITATGIYTVVGTNGSGCTTNMTGSATVISNATPPVFTVSGGGAYCSGGSGVSVNLNGSTAGVNYQLFSGATTVGSPVAGTGSSVSFGVIATAGTYTVRATNAVTTCNSNMSGSATVVVNPTPTTFNVGGGGNYCIGGAGLAVTLSGSQSGVNYQLYRSGVPLGGSIAGNGSAINFGILTEAGLYTVLASNVSTGCTATMSGSATIVVNTLPIIYPVTGGGNYCSGGTGVAIGLGGSATGVNYSLYNGATAIGSSVAGTNSPISFGVQTLTGTYTVFALNPSTGCSNNMSGSAAIGINSLPTSFPVTGSGSFCAGGTGLAVGLSSSSSGVNYSLFSGASLVSVISGTGSAISFGSITAAGTYTVQATNSITSCTAPMSGSAVINVNTLPTLFNVTATGTSYCSGGAGITVNLSGSTTGVNYQLFNGSSPVGLPVAGTGSAISFGNQTTAGTYSVVATNATTLCTRSMTGTATISINALPIVYSVIGGGSYCASGTGVSVSLTGSESNVNYQLYNGATAVGTAITGTGAAISFGLQTGAGAYTVVATNATSSCIRNMSGSASIAINPLPTAQTVTGGGTFCNGATGVTVGLNSSASGINYQLYNGAAAVGSAVPGTGSALNFGTFTTTGTYVVSATNPATGCTNNMTGNATVGTNPAPTVYTLTGGGSYCAGSTGVNIGLSGSNTGISYQLTNGLLPVGSPVIGTGAAIDFGTITTVGNYYVTATNTLTACTSSMSGSSSVVINALPSVFTVTGGGNYCIGGTGVNVGLNGSTPGIAYQLYNGTVPVGSLVSGTGLSLNFGVFTATGNYTVIGFNPATACSNNMGGSAVITTSTLPTIYTVTGGGSYCNGGAGVSIGLTSSLAGTSYQVYNGAAIASTPVLGTGEALDFGLFTVPGTYSVLATSLSSSCSNAMSATAVVAINALPTLHTIAGGGIICEGSTGALVTLNNSNTGVAYQLYNGSTTVGAPVPGTGSAISFGNQTGAGVYSVTAVNTTTGCERGMNSSVTITVNPRPTAQTVTGGGTYCAGDAGLLVGLASSSNGVNYQLYNGSTAVGASVSGTGTAINFGNQTGAGSYVVMATNTATTCTNMMLNNVTVAINPLPTAYTVLGTGSYCAGDAGLSIILSNSTLGVTYQLFNGTTPVGSAIAGTGTELNFGMYTDAGTYRIAATNDVTGCTTNMSGAAVISINALPAEYVVTGGGEYCAGGAGLPVGISSSNTGIAYQLYRGGVAIGAPLAGNGGDLSFGIQSAAGVYSVIATNSTTGCDVAMIGTAPIVINELPIAHAITGGGSLCAGDDGVNISLDHSTPGIDYQLYNGSVATGSLIAGTGFPIDFGLQTVSGSYIVRAINTVTSCSLNMTGTANVVVNPIPAAQSVTGGGNYCSGAAGVAVGLDGSAAGISYQLMNGTTPVGGAVAGTGTPISFGLQTGAGLYEVMATDVTTGCTNEMTGSATVTINSLPNAYAVLSMSSSYCAGGSGVNILLSGSDAGVSYQLFNGSVLVGDAIEGTGGLLDFGPQTTPGTYSVIANNLSTSCSVVMAGSASVIVNALPTAFTLTGGGGYCQGTSGAVVNLNGSTEGISYQLFSTTGAAGAPVVGTGGPISFGPQTAGSYVVIATNTATTCVNQMTGILPVVLNPAPTAYAVNGGGVYCAGGAGVPVGVAGSATGINYQLYKDGSAVGAMVAGTGAGISFGSQTAAGNYTVMAMNNTTMCTGSMTGSVTVSINELPATFDVTGGGAYCAGSGGVSVGLAGSAAGVNYQLYNGSVPVTGAILAGDGSALNFGMHSANGSYAVVATSTATGCTNIMTGTATVVTNALPIVYAVTGGGSYCSSATSTGLAVGVGNSQAGVSYQLYKDGSAVGAAVAGTGASISFGLQTAAGVYTVMSMNDATSCTNSMSGSTSIVVNPTIIPSVSINTGVGSTVCIGVLTTFTAIPVNGGSTPSYQWQVNGSNVGLGLGSYSYVPTDGDVVSVSMVSSLACATPAEVTDNVTMTVSSHVTPVARVSVMPNDTVCTGTIVTYSATADFGGTAPIFRWKKNGVSVGSGSTYTYVPTNGDVITCELTSNFPCRLEDVVTTDVRMRVTAPTTPVVTISANPRLSISAGQNLRLTASVTNGGTNPTYQWLLNGAVIEGATNASYMSTTFLDMDEVTCQVTSGGTCSGIVGSKTVVVTVTSLSVSDIADLQMDVRLVPNPNKGSFIVKGTIGNTVSNELNMDVTDMLGQIVYSAKVTAKNGVIDEKVQINNTLANGMYILNLRSETSSKAFHFVFQQ